MKNIDRITEQLQKYVTKFAKLRLGFNKLILVIILFLGTFVSAQTNLMVNGSFESSPTWSNWSYVNAAGNMWGGTGSACNPQNGSKYVWMADQYQNTGVNNAVEDIYQQVTIPPNASSCVLYFYVSINTLETSGSYDFMKINLRSTNGSLLTSFGQVDNSDGDYGIPGCQPWVEYSVSIPSSFYGQTVRISFEFTTDVTLPTIFRLDNIRLLAAISSPCIYQLSQTSYVIPNSTGGTYSSICNVITQAGCTWTAFVTSGSSWLSTNSSGSGNGQISINATSNNLTSPRTGTISIEGQTLTITQPGTSCTYGLSSNNYNLPNGLAGSYPNIVLVNTQAGCPWSATITSGGDWITSSSSGQGSGAVSVIVTHNASTVPRTATLNVAGQFLSITQPAGSGAGIYEEAESLLKVWPNPTYGMIAIELPKNYMSEINSILILDILGKVVLNQEIEEETTITLNLKDNGLQAGFYMLNLLSEKRIILAGKQIVVR
jgi:hypothetical protein